MRLCTFVAAGRERVGAVVDDRVVDLNAAYAAFLERRGRPRPRARADAEVPSDAVQLLAEGGDGLARAREAAAFAWENREELAEAGVVWPLSGVRLRPPVPRPGKIVCLGLNYRDHAAETNLPVPSAPVLFPKWPNALVGPGDPVVVPPGRERIDYEAELAFVVGRPASDVPAARALEYVAGYACFNDVSERELQFQTSQWTAGKVLDTFAPFGPYLVTADEVADPHQLGVRCFVNGEKRQDSNTRHFIFPIPEVLAFITSFMTLEPGDVIATGTPPGVQLGRPDPRWLRPGDVVRVEIDGLGALENPIVARSGARPQGGGA